MDDYPKPVDSVDWQRLQEGTVENITKHDKTLQRLQKWYYPKPVKVWMFHRWAKRKFPHVRAGFKGSTF